MADLQNPLFEDEKEFLERQKLEYERALLGDVDNIKHQTQTVGKYALIGAGLVGGVWLISKAFGGKSKHKDDEDGFRAVLREQRTRRSRSGMPRHTEVDEATTDDLGFGSGHHAAADHGRQSAASHRRAHLAPDVYHTDSDMDPFPHLGEQGHASSSYDRGSYPVAAYAGSRQRDPNEPSLAATAFQAFLQSDTGKMLIAQVSAVLMAFVAKKISEYLPVDKNPDLATSPVYATEPETRDIDFTYHHDDADAPHKPL
ncbi:hypothetical protein LJY25_04960 [Hymenobacter sp. BT175]|uniref:hypothetical protein n=1 Tax=Hymenobacter translucens TaxID=2886507 RepID=UPI001D0E2368|nr:hypothetical protein [Hymenobacter translucens]MCC2545787.1 hypothetical protein [Hymenobacter translucens]